MLGFSHGTIPLTMSLIGANTRGNTKKMTMSAAMFVAYCVGNMLGPQFFIPSEKPGYRTAMVTILTCYCAAAVMAMGLRFYLVRVNRRREREELVERLDCESLDGSGRVEEDITDWNMKGFRYRL